MNHQEAAKSGAVEKYLLGELQGQEREAFEDHFFDCAECASQVRLGAIFQANARAVVREDRKPFAPIAPSIAPGRLRWNLFPIAGRWNLAPIAGLAASAFLLALTVGYQNLVQIPRIRQSAPEGPAFSVVIAAPASGVRAATEQSFSRRAGQIFLFVPHEWEEFYNSYTCELEGRPGNQVLFTYNVKNGAGDFGVLIRTTALKPGKFVMNVYGVRADGQKTAVALFPLTLTD
jgi:hypothetical protein